MGPSLITDFLLSLSSFGLFKCPPKIVNSLLVGAPVQIPLNIYSMVIVFGHYCSGPDRIQKCSALYQFVESCSALLCLSLTFPFGLFGAWCLNTCLVAFSSEVLTWRSLFPPSAHSTQSVLGVDAEGNDGPCSRGYAPREDVLTPCLVGR